MTMVLWYPELHIMVSLCDNGGTCTMQLTGSGDKGRVM